MNPRVSVLMAVYNGAQYLSEAIDSIIQQTFTDLEFIIVDDGSSDNTPAILQQYAAKDSRIHILTQANAGLACALNRAWDQACGEYIARMDADDTSLPDRLQVQIEFMDTHTDIGVCGTWVRFVGERTGESHPPTKPDVLHCAMLFRNPLIHPTVMLRRLVFDSRSLRYDEAFRRAQDYALWANATQVTRLANLPRVLLNYRVNAAQTTATHRIDQLNVSEVVYRQQLEALGLSPTENEFNLHRALLLEEYPTDQKSLRELAAWLEKISRANHEKMLYPLRVFDHYVADLWFRACRAAAGQGLVMYQTFRHSALSKFLRPDKHAKLLVRSLLHKGNP